jgi:hypothetical protein
MPFIQEIGVKIIYDISGGSVGDMDVIVRTDAIVISENEFPSRPDDWIFAFRGDDRHPDEIFGSGFKKRIANCSLSGTASLASEIRSVKWSDVFGQREWGPEEWKNRTTIDRNQNYQLQANEVVFRPNYLDLLQQTCVSLSLDFELVAGFPLSEKTKTYSYIVKLPTKVLPTHQIQKDGGNAVLAESLEVTCNEIPALSIIGAAEIEREKKGRDANCTVEYRIVKWWVNVSRACMQDQDQYLLHKLQEYLRKDIKLAGERKVSAGWKPNVSTASNQVLRRAVEALAGKDGLGKHIEIAGGFTGEWPGHPTKKWSEEAKTHRRQGSFEKPKTHHRTPSYNN